MPPPSRLLVLSLAAVLAFAPAVGDAKRHSHAHGHHGWMHARFAAMRGWFRHVAEDGGRRERRSPARMARDASARRAAEDAALAARRRSQVDAYLREHPAFATAE